jgi:hypothetical protein
MTNASTTGGKDPQRRVSTQRPHEEDAAEDAGESDSRGPVADSEGHAAAAPLEFGDDLFRAQRGAIHVEMMSV